MLLVVLVVLGVLLVLVVLLVLLVLLLLLLLLEPSGVFSGGGNIPDELIAEISNEPYTLSMANVSCRRLCC